MYALPLLTRSGCDGGCNGCKIKGNCSTEIFHTFPFFRSIYNAGMHAIFQWLLHSKYLYDANKMNILSLSNKSRLFLQINFYSDIENSIHKGYSVFDSILQLLSEADLLIWKP